MFADETGSRLERGLGKADDIGILLHRLWLTDGVSTGLLQIVEFGDCDVGEERASKRQRRFSSVPRSQHPVKLRTPTGAGANSFTKSADGSGAIRRLD